MLLEPIHGVVCSVGYHDFLDVALTHNRPLFSTQIVVTTPEDKQTQRVAGKHNCRLVISEDCRKDPGFVNTAGEVFGVPPEKRTVIFNKGAMIERGLQQLPQNGWRCQWDADIIFPGNARERLGTALYDKSCIYGVDRMNVVGWDAWQKLLASGWGYKGFEHHHFLTYSINKSEIGSRLIYGDQGWCPIGFVQIFHSESEYSGIYRTRPYPTGSSTAAHDDIAFSLTYDRSKRVLIPEILVAHLMTPDMSYGKNWNGRVSRQFGPDKPENPDNIIRSKTISGSC